MTISSLRSVRFWCILALLLFAHSIVRAQEIETNPQFGVIESYVSPDEADQLGVGWSRVRFHWGDIQPNNPDEWVQVRITDERIERDLSAGRELIGVLIGIPEWGRGEDLMPAGLYLPYDDPNNTWAHFVSTAVARYAGRVDRWIIWNEPDIWDKETPGHTWDGDEADFAQLMRVSYLAAKDANPDAVVHLSAMTYFWDHNFGRIQYLDRLLTVLDADPEAAANNYYFDVATAHLYFQPQQIFDILTEWRGIMEAHGLDKEWWLVETNAPVSDDPIWDVETPLLIVTQPDQARFMPQMAAVALAAGVERIEIFKMRDTEMDRLANPEPFGLLRLDGSERPGFRAYQVVVDRLRGVTEGVRERWDDEVAQIRLAHENGTQTHILFTRGGYPATVELGAIVGRDSAELVHHMGESTTIYPENGLYKIDLPASECNQPIATYCMIGGDTYYLIQHAPPPVATNIPEVTPLPDPTNVPLPTETMTPIAAEETALINAKPLVWIALGAAIFAFIMLISTVVVIIRKK